MKKRLISLLLTVVMLLSLVVVPANAALVSGTGTLTITPNVTSVKGSTSAPAEVIYTIKVTPPTEGPVGEFHFNLKAPDGMTLSEVKLKPQAGNKGGDGYWLNMNDLWYNPVTEEGIFETFEYTPASKYFQAAGTNASRNMTTEAEIMTIKATIAAGKVGDFILTAENVGINKDGTDSYSFNVKTTPVTVVSALTGDLPVTITAPVKGGTPKTTISGTNYTGSITWTPAVTGGKFAANTAYTATVTLTAKTGYQFANDVNPTVTDATISGKSVSTDGKTLTFDAKFPKTENKTLTGITIDSAPTKTEYTVGEEFEKKGMTIKATYDDSTHAIVTDTSKFTVKPEGALTMTDTKVTVSYAEGGVTKTAEQIITVKAKALTDAMVSLDKGAYAYTGSQIQPTVTVKDGATTLKKDTDYTVAYGANNTVGTKVGTVTITGKGDYSGTIEKKFNITAKALTANMVQPIASQSYTGSPIVPKLTVKDGETALSKDTDYTVEYQNNLNAGTATVTVTGKGNYSDSVSKTFTIEPKSITPVVTVSGDYTYTGSAITPAYTVEITKGGLKIGDDQYTVEFSDNTNAGTGKIIVKAKDGGNYSFDAVSQTFTIKQKNVTAQRDATDIQVVVDKGTFDAPTFGDVKGTLTYSYDGATSYDAIVKKLKTLQLGATGDIGYTYTATANGNYTGTITGTLHFTVVNLPAATITTAPAAKTGLTFNGTEQVLVNAGSGITGGTLQYKLDGGSYNAELPKATNAGNYTVYYKVKGNNTTHSDSSEQSFTVTIAPKTVTAAVSVEPTSYTYTGEAIVPTTVTVKDGTTVIPASEYTVTYGNNTNAGKATVTVKDQDGGNYVVSGTATFTITKAALSGVTVSLKDWMYGDTAKTPTVSGNLGGGNVTYQYKADNASTYTSTVPTNAGTYTVKATVAESANYKAATATGSFTIAPKTVTNAAVTLSQTSYAYTGRAFQPSVTVKDGTTVIPASEYTVAYTDNTNVGTATVTVSDRAGGNYVVSGTATFTITKAALSGVSVSLGGWTYGDTAKTPTVSGNLGNANVTYQYKAVDAADETYTNVVPTNAGTYTVKATVAESANYAAATATRNFTIVPKAISKATVENIGEQEFTGRTITPTVTVKDGTVVLTDADYSVAYANNIDAGTANVTITGKGNYTASTSVKFTIAQAAAPVVVDDSGATVTAPDTTKENVAGKLDETGKTKYNKDSKGEVTTDEEIILGNVKKAMGVTGTNSTMITAQVTTSGSATKAMTVLPYAQGADSRKNFTVKKLNADGTIETIDSRNVVKMAAGLKLELEDGAIYAISWTTPSSSGSGRSYTSGQSFTTDLPADSINRVTVNGKKLDSKNYTVSSNGSGSIVTLLQSYLDTLKVGKYTVKIENKTHVSTGTFTIKADGTLSSPRTADAGVCLYAAMALMSGTGAAYVTLRRKKEN